MVNYLDGLTDDELKKESKNEAKNDALSSIIKVRHCFINIVHSSSRNIIDTRKIVLRTK